MTSIAAELRSILDVIEQPAWAVDADHRVSYANPRVAALTGHDSPSDLLGTDGRPGGHPGARSRHHAAPSHRCGTLTHADGSLLHVEWSLVPLARPDGEAAVYLFRTSAGPSGATREPSPKDGVPRALAAQVCADRCRTAAGSLRHGAQERLASLLLGLSLAREQLGGSLPSPGARLLDDAARDAEEALAQVREVTAALYPGVLELRGLTVALTALAEQWPVPVAVFGNLRRRLPDAVETHAYFLVRDALSRAVHGAGAGRVRVVAELDPDSDPDLDPDLVVTVSDDGTAPGHGPEPAFLAAIAGRVALLEGTLTVRHTPEEGTTISVVIPVPY
ncbi:PAS domain-containing protein [Streptomyces sp. NRRL S-31]|uniref:sensor histidine kinase n=1 Tax=Streptomyces sp. NRRL S-31 TaxID=1463898 RepID=UPI0004C4B5AC|nr:PAS domain-containing protein [Streptomyces sp. NRRL S-31]